MKRLKCIFITSGIFAIILAISFYLPEQPKETVPENSYVPVLSETAVPVDDKQVETAEPTKNEIKETLKPTPTPDAPFKTAEPQAAPVEKNTLSCTLTVRCDIILNNIEKLSPEKLELVPENGIILAETEMEFSDGDTVFDVLEKELKSRNIHFEFNKAPMSDSVYIEGIGNLYEFDCGNLSGWIYRVNGKTTSLGCSQYKLKNGDKIEWVYTCNLGKDVN